MKCTSAFLIGKTINSETILQTEEVLQAEIVSINDVRDISTDKRTF